MSVINLKLTLLITELKKLLKNQYLKLNKGVYSASHGMDSERQVGTGFLFLSFDILSCSTQKPFWFVGKIQLFQRILTQTEPLSRTTSIFEVPYCQYICMNE